MDIYLYIKNGKNIFAISPFIGLEKDWTLLKNATVDFKNNYITVNYYIKDYHLFDKGFYKINDIEKYNIPRDNYFKFPFGLVYLKNTKIEKDKMLLYQFSTNNWEYHTKYDPNTIHTT